MARVIGSAEIRLTANSTGLALEFRRVISQALKEAAATSGEGSTDGVRKDAERTKNRVVGILSGLSSIGQSLSTKLASSLLTAVTSGVQLGLIGVKAGIALAGISSLATGVVGLVGVLGQAAGAAGLLPAAFIAIKTVTATLSLALDGLDESFSALASGDAQAFQESLKGLAPSARSFVTEISKVKPAFDSIKLNLQNTLFQDLGKSVAPLAKTYLPTINEMFQLIGKAGNDAAKSLIQFARDGETAGQVRLLTSDIAASFRELVPAITPAASALLDIGQTGATFLPGLADSVSGLATRFADFIRNAAASGQLSAFFQNALDTIKQLGQVIGAFGQGLVNVFRAADQAGGGFLNGLQSIANAFRDFTGSTEGQAALVSFFSSMRAIIQSVLPVVLSLAQVIGRDLAPILANLAATVGPAFLSVTEGIGTALRGAAPGIAALGQGIATLVNAAGPLIAVFGQIAGSLLGGIGDGLTSLAPAFAEMAKALSAASPSFAELGKGMAAIIKAAAPLLPLIAQLAGVFAGALGAILQQLAPVLEQLATALATGLQAILPQIIPIVTQLAQIFAQLLVQLLPLIPVFLQIVQAVLPLLPPLLQLVAAVLPSLVSLVQGLTPLIVALASVFSNLIPIFTTVVETIIGVLLPPIQLIATVVTAVAEVVANVFDAIAGVIRTVLGAISSVVTSVWSTIVGVFTNAVTTVKNFVVGGFNAIRDFFGRILGDIGRAVGDGIENVIGFFRDLPGKVLGFLGDIAGKAVKAGEDIIGGIIRGLGNFAGKIIDKIGSIVSDAWDAVVDFFDIFSPSKLAIRTFEFVGEGMVIGLDNMSKDVKNAALSLSQTAVDGLNEPISAGLTLNPPILGNNLTGAAQGVAGGLVLNQNITMLPGANVQQFSAEVWRRAALSVASGNSLLDVSQQSVQSGLAAPGSVVSFAGV